MNLKKTLSLFVNLYPVWIVLSSLIGFFHPPALEWFSGDLMLGAFALVMLGMGFSLEANDFKAIFKMPSTALLGIGLQYSVMPLSAWGIGKVLNLEPELAVGLIIVGCCPGGMASNVIAFLARGNLALSIVLTTLSTFLAVIATPLLCQALAGKYVPVDAWGLFSTTLKVVLVPVTVGIFCNYRFPKLVKKVAASGPIISVWALIFIAGGIVAQGAETVAANFLSVFLATTLLHLLGFLLGYVFCWVLGYDSVISRTMSIEIGMQNGGLGAVLAKQNFSMYPLAPVPAVFSSVIQNIIGGLLAGYWRYKHRPKQS